MRKIKTFCLSLLGEFIKFLFDMGILKPVEGINKEENRNERIIVSLTSYGRRVSKILPYTIFSLLFQTKKPDMIIVWLDNEHWNDENLPKKLLDLKKYGLTIRFCDDLGSYKKLIPALHDFPDDIIITCDDDVYYTRNMVERLVLEYEKNPTSVHVHRAHHITFTKTGSLEEYNNWKHEVSRENNHLVFATGVGGCLYKKSLLYKDVCNKELFLKLAPKADDVWFYFMELLEHTSCSVLQKQGEVFIPLDGFYQFFHSGARLTSSNCFESQNDVQIQSVMNYYNVSSKDLQAW